MAHSETRLANFVRCKADFSTNPINSDKSRAGAKIAEAKLFDRVPPPHVGGRDPTVAGTVTFQYACTAKATSGAKLKAEASADILTAVKERRA